MIRHYIRSTIIVLIQSILPIMALVVLAPWFINTQWQEFINHLQPGFLVFHGLFYLSIIGLWPRLIQRLQTNHEITREHLKMALNIRWYLLAIFLFIDTLMLIRTL